MHDTPVVKDLILIGGGHSHVAVLKAFGMRAVPGLRITLVSRDTHTPYSGMLPGLIAGHYTEDEVHIDLVPLCQFAGARFIKASARGLDLKTNEVLFDDRPPLPFDVLSINSGSTPSLGDIAHNGGELIRVKPIDRFLEQWRKLLERVECETGPRKIAIVGGGAGGVELMLAIEHRLRPTGHALSFSLLTAEPEILVSHSASVRRRFNRLFAERGIDVRTRATVVARDRDGIILESGEALAFDHVFFVTHAAAAPWIAEAGLGVDERGFLLVDECLRSVSHANVFGVGDVAAMRGEPRPKSGVFAVRQGKPLTRNLRRAVLNQRLRSYIPQRRFLSLIGTGGRSAVASRGGWAAQGAWVWAWKELIDRRFMRRFQELPDMDTLAERPLPPELQSELPTDPHRDEMRCGGCGAKVGADALSSALSGLGGISRDDVVVGLDQPDDAAVVTVPADKLSVLTVDVFRSLVDDPYLFGKIVANHCLNDLYAVGAEPQTAMAIATLPVWPERKLVAELRQMLSGALAVLSAEGAELVGGHTSEGAELSLGLSLTGLVSKDSVLHKRGLRAGDCLVLTKPIGTGTIFAANMRGKASGRWVDGAVDSMVQSNREASRCLRSHSAVACTDVTGFGIAGHLGEMLGGAPLSISIHLNQLPILAGATQCMALGWISTLHDKNVAAAARISGMAAAEPSPLYSLMFDPQTAGGLLAGIPSAEAAACVSELHELGYVQAAVIGYVDQSDKAGVTISLD